MADIMRIKVPDTVLDVGADQSQKFDFWAFIRYCISTHSVYNMDAAGIRAACRLERYIEVPGKTLDLDMEDFNKLRQAAENPTGGYPIRPGSKCLPFVDAICNAAVVQHEREES